MATINTSYKLPNAEVIDWLKTDAGTDFGSYIVLNYPPDCTSSESTSEKNPFEGGNIDSGEAVPIAYRSPDIDYNATAGTVTVNTAGNYLVYFAPMWATTNSASSTTFITTFKIKKNGSAIYTTVGLKLYTLQDPAQVVCHTVVALAAGDEITATFDSASGSIACGCVAGTTLMLLRISGHFGVGHYTSSGSDTNDTGNMKTFDQESQPDGSNPGIGGVSTNTNGVTYISNGGKFDATDERLFINLQSLLFSVDGPTSSVQNRLTIDNSTGDHGFMDIMLAGLTADASPVCHTQQILKAIPAGLAAVPTAKEPSSGTDFSFKKGTCFSLIDVSNNGGVPSSFLCTVITSDGSSSSLSTTEINIYDDDNYGTLTTVDPNDEANKAVPDGEAGVVAATIGGNRGIVYNPTNGTFTFSESGDYLIMSNLGVDSVTSNENGCFHHIKKNNTDIAFTFFFMRSNRDPVTNLLTTIAPFEKDDVLTVAARRNSGTAHVQDGTSIIIVRLGPVQTAAPGFNQLFDGGSNGTGQPIVKTDDTIDSADKGDQRDRRTEQSPFRMTVNGPLTLRGRARSSLPFNVAAGKRGGKK